MITQKIKYYLQMFLFVFHKKKETALSYDKKIIKKNTSRKKVVYEDIGTHFQTIGHLLSGLDETFAEMDKLKPKADWAQRLIKRYGPYVMGMKDGHSNDKFFGDTLEDIKSHGLPSFLMNYHPEGDSKFVRSFFIALKKEKHSLIKQKNNNVFYECIWMCMLDKELKKRLGYNGDVYPIGYYVMVDKLTGKVTPLKQKIEKEYVFRKKSHKQVSYVKSVLEYPDHRQTLQVDNGISVIDDLRTRFCLEYNASMRREYGVNIYVKKGKSRAVFTVPSNRWKYFFKDRIDAIAKDGKKKRIFHAVAAHHRNLKNGKLINVRTHYRGSRNFFWNGYGINIVMQGKHGVSQATLGLAASDIESKKVPKGYIDICSKKTSSRLNALFEGDQASLR